MSLQNQPVFHFQVLFTYITPKEPQLAREDSPNFTSDQWDCARTRRASDMKQSKLCNIQEKGKFPLSLREPFPEGLRVAEKGKMLWVVIPENSILPSLKVVSHI